MKRPAPSSNKSKITATPTSSISKINNKQSTIPTKYSSSGGIKHQVILPKTLVPSPIFSKVVASSSASASSSSAMSSLNNNPTIAVTNPLQQINGADISATYTSLSSTSSSSFPSIIDNTTTYNNNNNHNTNIKVWYLGGNHVVKLLTSVDGDLDHAVLSKLAHVPTVIGELALSVESLVSDDITVGGFENDLLAKIASNTLTAKRDLMAHAAAAAVAQAAADGIDHIANNNTVVDSSSSSVVNNNNNNNNDTNKTTVAMMNANAPPVVPAISGQVPSPLLANYQPVPNPLAAPLIVRITPPASPSLVVVTTNIIPDNNNNNNKRKQDSSSSSSSSSSNSPKPAKAMRTTTTTTTTEIPMIQAR
jgi:hypothetical protein